MDNFKKISEATKEKILQYTLINKTVIVFKYSGSKIIRARIENLNRKYYITCRRPKDLVSLRTKEQATAVIPYQEERYFFKSFLHIEGNSLFFRRDSEMFHLKRRKNKRLKIPTNYPAMLMIKKQNHNLTFLRATIHDFSDLGCKVTLNTESPAFKKGDLIIGTLRIGNKKGVEINAEVKHHFRSKKGKNKQTFGLQFIKLSAYQESYIKSLFLDLQREIFMESY
ncbi:MAG: PilZ domain-containing protein [Bdellovibrionales bacterium]|nr:PilZ domain-containing protein [Bdellovibrionales bacterium]